MMRILHLWHMLWTLREANLFTRKCDAIGQAYQMDRWSQITVASGLSCLGLGSLLQISNLQKWGLQVVQAC